MIIFAYKLIKTRVYDQKETSPAITDAGRDLQRERQELCALFQQ
jgi:hypothetical protein